MKTPYCAAWFEGGDAKCDVPPALRTKAFRLVLLEDTWGGEGYAGRTSVQGAGNLSPVHG